jgi:replication factor C small subunit
MEDNAIWTEKYRPKKFESIKGQSHIIDKVKAFVEQKNMPHLLFAGPAGVGKTTLSLVVAQELFGEEWHNNFLELNASDERGIDIVRNKVKDFARTKAIGNVPFKIIYLDECDALTKEAQQALRRTMENYTTTCRFILSCNYSSKIIDPIQSRCLVFKFKPLSKEEIFEIIENISKKEGLTLDKKTKEALFEASEGDCRRVENIMQSAASLNKKFDEEIIFTLASLAKPKEMIQILDFCAEGNFNSAKKLLLDVMLEYGLSGIDVIKQLQKEIWSAEKIDKHAKLDFVKACGEAEFHMVEGSDEYIQLESLIANLVLNASKK